jgi:hypothetical protein
MKTREVAALLIAASIFLTVPNEAFAQNQQQPQVSMVNLQVVANPDGSQSVVTPKGDLAFLPGKGVDGSVAQIYMGSQGGFWYVDRTGQTVDLTPAVDSLKARRARAAQVPQYAPMPEYGAYGGGYNGQPSQQQYDQQQMQMQQQQLQMQQQQMQMQQQQEQQASQEKSSDGGGRGSGVLSAVGTAAAAGAGAMAGAALSNNRYYNAPYGTPYYYGNGGNPYYYDHNNERREMDDLSPNQKAVMYNKHQINQKNQQSQQAAVSQAQTNRQSQQANRESQQASRQSQFAAAGQPQGDHQSRQHQNYQQQQLWYSSQLKDNPNKFQRSESNPFANEHSGSRAESRGDRSSREGRSSRDGRSGGGFSEGRSGGGFSGGRSGGGFSGGRSRGGGGRRR